MIPHIEKSEVGKRGFSGSVWHTCPIEALQEGSADGVWFEDNFHRWVDDAGTGYTIQGDTGVTHNKLTTERGSVLQIAGADADNDDGSIQAGGVAGLIAPTIGADPFWFEADVRFPTITETGVAVGLAQEALAVGGALADNTAALADIDFIGFLMTTHASAQVITATYRKNGQTAVEVYSGTTGVPAVDTWYKLGVQYTPLYGLKFFVDGVQVGSTIKTVDLSSTTFPSGEEVSPILALKAGEASEKQVDIRHWAVAQLIEPTS